MCVLKNAKKKELFQKQIIFVVLSGLVLPVMPSCVATNCLSARPHKGRHTPKKFISWRSSCGSTSRRGIRIAVSSHVCRGPLHSRRRATVGARPAPWRARVRGERASPRPVSRRPEHRRRRRRRCRVVSAPAPPPPPPARSGGRRRSRTARTGWASPARRRDPSGRSPRRGRRFPAAPPPGRTSPAPP